MVKSLRDILKKKSSKHYRKFIHITNVCRDILPKIRITFPEYINHTVKHVENVENILEVIVPENVKKSFNHVEIFCLLCAVWLHDVGKVLDDEEGFKKAKPAEKELIRKITRENHHERSYNCIKNMHSLNLTPNEAEAIGNICKVHRKIPVDLLDDNFKINKKKVRLQLLGACLRLADKFDVNSQRISKEFNQKDGFIWIFPPHKKKVKNNFADFNFSNGKIRIIARVSNLKDLKLIISTKEKIKKQIDEYKSIFIQNELPFKNVKLKVEMNF